MSISFTSVTHSPTLIVRCVLVFALMSSAAGCAINNQYAYDQARPGLVAAGTQSVAVATVDRRPYVINGDKAPDFVGLQRGGYGNPFDVTTTSGKALADDLTTSVAGSLDTQGYDVQTVSTSAGATDDDTIEALKGTGAAKLVFLTLNELKSDTMVNVRYLYDLTLQVRDGNGDLLAETTAKGDEKLGGSVINPVKVANEKVPEAARTTLESLFNSPAIVKALGG